MKHTFKILVAFMLVSCSPPHAGEAAGDKEHSGSEWIEKARQNFPYRILTATGRDAFSKWKSLRTESQGYPVIIGGDEELSLVLEPFDPAYYGGDIKKRSVAEILEAASRLRHPESFLKYKKEREAQLASYFEEQRTKAAPRHARDGDQTRAMDPDLAHALKDALGDAVVIESVDEFESAANARTSPEIGAWPIIPPGSPGLSVVRDILSGKFLDRVYIVILPTDDWTHVPAYLLWGDWNDNPPPEYHLSALRSWRDRYGAELVGISGDVLNIRVSARPKSRDEALKLARDMYEYNYDIVEQGTGTLAPLAASLMGNDWWYFWWD